MLQVLERAVDVKIKGADIAREALCVCLTVYGTEGFAAAHYLRADAIEKVTSILPEMDAVSRVLIRTAILVVIFSLPMFCCQRSSVCV